MNTRKREAAGDGVISCSVKALQFGNVGNATKRKQKGAKEKLYTGEIDRDSLEDPRKEAEVQRKVLKRRTWPSVKIYV